MRVRHALGLKNIKYNLVWLLNDDISTPTALIGKKMVPIFQPEGPAGPSMGESLDIIKLIDSDEKFGNPGLFKPETPNLQKITEVLKEILGPLGQLTRVRHVAAPLPEFAFADAREAFVCNYPTDLDTYEDTMNNSEQYIAEVQSKLEDLSELIYSKEHCSPGGLSYDDFVLFPRVRSMTIVKGLELPQKMREYVEYQAHISEVPLYDFCAI